MTDPTRMTELDLLVGSIFTTRPEEDRELFEEEREWLSDIQDLLREEGIEVDLLSKPGVELWEGGIEHFMDLYQLRLLAAYIEQGQDITPLRDFKPETATEPDPLLAAIWEGEQTTRFAHLINHQADGGYYLLVDFAEPIWLEFDQDDDENGHDCRSQWSALARRPRSTASLSSSNHCSSRPAVPEQSAPYRCLRVLRDAVDQSVSNDLPIIIW